MCMIRWGYGVVIVVTRLVQDYKSVASEASTCWLSQCFYNSSFCWIIRDMLINWFLYIKLCHVKIPMITLLVFVHVWRVQSNYVHKLNGWDHLYKQIAFSWSQHKTVVYTSKWSSHNTFFLEIYRCSSMIFKQHPCETNLKFKRQCKKLH